MLSGCRCSGDAVWQHHDQWIRAADVLVLWPWLSSTTPPPSICIACVQALLEHIICFTIANRKLSCRGGSPHISDLKLVHFVCISGTLRPGHTPAAQLVGPTVCTSWFPALQESIICAVTWRREGRGENRLGLNNLWVSTTPLGSLKIAMIPFKLWQRLYDRHPCDLQFWALKSWGCAEQRTALLREEAWGGGSILPFLPGDAPAS